MPRLKSARANRSKYALDCSVYMTVFGRFLEMSPEDVALLGHLGLLQDVGKVRVPTALLEKRERVTEPELFLRPNQVGYVGQLPRVLSGTVADNIALGHQVDADEAVCPSCDDPSST